MNIEFEFICNKMDSTIEVLKKEFRGIRTGRASPSIFEAVRVNINNVELKIDQVSTINTIDARSLIINVWDRNIVKNIEKAIQEANLGLNPIVEGQIIRVPLPPLSEQRRKELSKMAHKYAEEAKIAIRNIRRDGMEELKKKEKNKEISENDLRKKNLEIQTIVDKYIKKIDLILDDKDKEILQK